MSTQIAVLHNTGSRRVDLEVIRYFGGKIGTCYQLMGKEEEGRTGYVQLNKKDIKKLYAITIGRNNNVKNTSSTKLH